MRGSPRVAHNDRPFAGFPAGHLRIVRTGCEPGPVIRGVRLYVATVDVALAGGPGGRMLDFASLPPVPVFTDPPEPPVAPRGGRHHLDLPRDLVARYYRHPEP